MANALTRPEFVEGVLGIGPIPVELPQTEDFVIGVGHKHRLLVAGDALAGLAVGFDEGEQLLSVRLALNHHLARQRPTQHDHPALALPAGKLKFAILAFPALSGVRPARLAEQATNVTLDVLRSLSMNR